MPPPALWLVVGAQWMVRNVCGTRLNVRSLPVSFGQQSTSGQHKAKAGVLPESGDHAHPFGSVQVQHKDIFHHEETNQDIRAERFQYALCKTTLSPF